MTDNLSFSKENNKISSSLSEDKIDLVSFLKELTEEIMNDTITTENLSKITDFYLGYKHEDKFLGSSEKEIMKYYCMGWYIYQHKEKHNHD